MGETTKKLQLSLIIPVYNQGKFVAKTLEALRSEFSDIDMEIILVDDGSKQDVDLIGADLIQPAERLHRFEENRGKGAAVKKGVELAEGEVIMYTDVDLSYSPKFLRELFLAIKDSSAAAFGVRQPGRMSLKRTLGSRIVGRCIKKLLGKDSDTQCGAKAFSHSTAKEVFSQITIERFAFDVEVWKLLQEANVEVRELPAEAERRQGSTLRLKDGVRFILDLRKIRLNLKRGHYGKNQ